MSSTAYKIFVMQAHENGQEIEVCVLDINNKIQPLYDIKVTWNWEEFYYRIKLPAGYEYVIEYEEIAFRKPKKGESFLFEGLYIVFKNAPSGMSNKRPIIKKTTIKTGG